MGQFAFELRRVVSRQLHLCQGVELRVNALHGPAGDAARRRQIIGLAMQVNINACANE